MSVHVNPCLVLRNCPRQNSHSKVYCLDCIIMIIHVRVVCLYMYVYMYIEEIDEATLYV